MDLQEPFKSLWQTSDAFLEVKKLVHAAPKEKIYRNKEGRITLQFEAEQKSYFLKYHSGVGWKEVVKNLLQGRLPVLSAANEYHAARQLTELAIDTLKPVAFSVRGSNPARQESFLITEDLTDTTSLEDYCKHWAQNPPGLKEKRALIKKVATSARAMHKAGINHRDFYICHFLLENKAPQKIANNEAFFCYLIDLHRCQKRKQVPRRWHVKDLGGLLYSSMDIGLSRNDCFYFIKHYTGLPLKKSLADPLWQSVLDNAQALYQKDFQRPAPSLFDRSASERSGGAGK